MTTKTTEPQGSNLPATQERSLALVLPRVADESPRLYMARLMEMLPPPGGDVIDKIIGQILNAPSPQEENELWDALGSQRAVGRRFIFRSVHIQPSDYEDSVLPYFLICRVTDCDSGEETVLTTGSTNICTSLVKAQLLGELPWEAEIVAPKRKPRSGKVPLRLRWVAKVMAPEEDE